jgi:hypothetical protein
MKNRVPITDEQLKLMYMLSPFADDEDKESLRPVLLKYIRGRVDRSMEQLCKEKGYGPADFDALSQAHYRTSYR